jgi:hypothetical protein
MNRLLFLLVTVVITCSVTHLKGHQIQQKALSATQKPHNVPKVAKAPINVQEQKRAATTPPVAEAAQTKPPDIVQPRALTCREAIDQVWPTALRDGAKIVLEYENRSENAQAVGSVNGDGSRDYGCMQINNKAHPQFFATEDWSNPVANVTEGLKIYQGRQSVTGNGWQAWYAVAGVLY